jgi:hypothetical protein
MGGEQRHSLLKAGLMLVQLDFSEVKRLRWDRLASPIFLRLTPIAQT